MKQEEKLEQNNNFQTAEQQYESKIALMLTTTPSKLALLSNQQFLSLQKYIAEFTDERLDNISLLIRREARIRQIIATKHRYVYSWSLDHILQLIKQIQEINDERLIRRGIIYSSELRILILKKQIAKQRQLSWKNFLSFFKRSVKDVERPNEPERERLTNLDSQQVEKLMELKSTNHHKSQAQKSKKSVQKAQSKPSYRSTKNRQIQSQKNV